MTALVLGATGLIGSHTRAELAQRDLEALGTSTTGEGMDFALELTDRAAVDHLINDVEPGLVIHTGGISSLAEAWQRPARTFEVNSAGTLNLLESLARHAPEAHLVFASSAAVYGPPSPAGEAFTENSPIRPASPYAASKAAAEILCGQYGRERGIGISVVRIFNQVGPGQSVSQAPSEFAREIARAEAAGRDEVTLRIGNPDAERDFTDVGDTARAIADLATGRIRGTFNLCSGQARSLRELACLLAEATPLEVTIAGKPDHDRPADVNRITGSPAKLAAKTGWRPEVPLERSLASLLADWRADRVRLNGE